jgi:N6-L-threonylcarbamoyladenine synthase
MLVLGIETSCDETGLALVADGRRVLAAQLASSLKQHQKYGGVIPEIASRAHVELLTCELEALMAAAKVSPSQVDRIAVTHGPGLSGALLVGVAAAKGLGLAWRKDLVPVNHLHAHLYAGLMDDPDPPLQERMIGLVISGGHTALVRMDGIGRYTLLGQTRDDAVGEAFDKVAKLLGLKFPGGPEIERAAKEGNPSAFRFTVPKMKSGNPYEFSLSGIKTAVLYKVREFQKAESRKQNAEGPLLTADCLLPSDFVSDMAASFQSAIVEEVTQKTVRACRDSGIVRLVVGGGVVANGALRRRLEEACVELAIRVRIPPTALCTDNGAMVAGLGFHLQVGDPKQLTALPELGVS